MTTLDTLIALGRRLDSDAQQLSLLNSYYSGTQPLAYLSDDARAALGSGFRTLSVELPKLAVDSLAERLDLQGFRIGGAEAADPGLWAVWTANGMPEMAPITHTEALTLGRSFVFVWAGDNGRPLVTVESPTQVAVARDPATREPVAAVKRWEQDGYGRAVVLEPDRITRYRTEGRVVQGAGIPSTGWRVVETLDNPLGTIPVVPFVNRGRLLDTEGISEMDPILDVCDALNKVMSDAMVSSEYFARPRRWVTGMEIVEDADGNPVDPFSEDTTRVWQAENPETRFGQFEQVDLASYANLTATLTQQIGAVSGLPPHYLGLNGDQPPSADAIRSAEASLVARALAKQRSFGRSWAQVAALILAVQHGVDPRSVGVEPVWADPSTRTPAQTADAVVKLHAEGILPTSAALERLGYSPPQIERINTQRVNDSLASQGVNLDDVLS